MCVSIYILEVRWSLIYEVRKYIDIDIDIDIALDIQQQQYPLVREYLLNFFSAGTSRVEEWRLYYSSASRAWKNGAYIIL